MRFGRLDRSFLYLELESFKVIFKSVTLTGVVFYAIMLILSTFYAGYYVFQTVDEYLNSPMNTEFNVVTANQMTLPQIYVCSPIKVTKSFYEQNSDLYRKAEMLRLLYFGKSFDLDTTEANWTSILDMTAENMHALYKNMSTDLYKFWIQIQFRKITVSDMDLEEITTQVFDPQHGICYVVDVGSECKQLYHSEALTMAIDLSSAEYPTLESGAVPEFLGVKVSN
uniref:Uncharacterized protein n=1 Tax=Romanomermis culicivorax TaxID=13658 RepID=A0A915L2K3_ROMCU